MVFLLDTSHLDHYMSQPNYREQGIMSEVWSLPVQGREKLWEKMKLGLSRVNSQLTEQYDFMLKADDDTFINMPALRSILPLLPTTPFVFGHK